MTQETDILPAIEVDNWVARRVAQKKQDGLSAELSRQRKRADSLLIAAKSPGFVLDLVRELIVTAETLKGLGMIAMVGSFGPSAPNSGYRASVTLTGQRPRMTHTDLFYAPGDDAIRCHALEGKVDRLAFCVLSDDEVGVLADSGKIMKCEAAARHIMEPMVSLVEKPTI